MGRYKLNGDDIAGFSRDSKDIIFDKTGTNYTSDDVDGVLREIDGDLSDIITRQRHSISISSVSASGTASNSVAVSAITGYKPIGICGMYVSNGDLLISDCYYDSNTDKVMVSVYNKSNSSQSGTVYAHVLYVREW